MRSGVHSLYGMLNFAAHKQGVQELVKIVTQASCLRNVPLKNYDLWSFKNLEIAGRKRKDVNFASLIIQSGYVGFYYMPIYTDTSLKDVFEPELLKLLKGKSCFHIKKLDERLESQIEKALKIGYELYKERGWI